MSALVQAALQSAVQRQTFPKANLDIYCLVLESGGADTAVAITAASLALADAGVEMYDLVSACSVVRFMHSFFLFIRAFVRSFVVCSLSRCSFVRLFIHVLDRLSRPS